MRKAAHGYVVMESTPGYLPDVEPAWFGSLRQAERYAATLARALRECGYTVKGSAQGGCYYAERDPDDLGLVIEIVEAEEPDPEPTYDWTFGIA